MSDQTRAALDDAIAAHLADDTDGALLTGYVLSAAGIRSDAPDGSHTVYKFECADGQSHHAGVGLTHALLDWFKLEDE